MSNLYEDLCLLRTLLAEFSDRLEERREWEGFNIKSNDSNSDNDDKNNNNFPLFSLFF